MCLIFTYYLGCNIINIFSFMIFITHKYFQFYLMIRNVTFLAVFTKVCGL